ncbi:MAG: Rab family GTPase [Candidatus Odinarchaeota archaeon]
MGIRVESQNTGVNKNVKVFEKKVLLLGDEYVGKTSLLNHFLDKDFESNYLNTLGVEVTKKDILIDDDTVIVLNIWDLSGRAVLASYRRHFFEETDGALLVFDLTRRKTLTELINWNDHLQSHSECSCCVLVGNKSDLETERDVFKEEPKSYTVILNTMTVFETSAKTGENVNDVFYLLARSLYKKEKEKSNG